MIKINLKQAMDQYNNESSFGHNLHKRLTLRKLHQFTGVSIHALSDIYNGNVKSIKLDNLNRLVSFFGGSILSLISYIPDIKQIILSGNPFKPVLVISTNNYSGKLSININVNSNDYNNNLGSYDINLLCKSIVGNSIKNCNLINYLFSNTSYKAWLLNYLLLQIFPQISMFHHEHMRSPLSIFTNILVDDHDITSVATLLNNDQNFSIHYYSSLMNMIPFKIINNFAK